MFYIVLQNCARDGAFLIRSHVVNASNNKCIITVVRLFE